MWEQIENWLPTTVAFLFLLAFPAGLFAVWIRRRRIRRAFVKTDDNLLPVEGTEQERLRSEQEQSVWSENKRVQLARDHEIVGRLNTIDGYSEAYVLDLLQVLKAADIRADFYFQETSPIGVGASLIERHGDFEIFVERNRVEEAVALIEKFRG